MTTGTRIPPATGFETCRNEPTTPREPTRTAGADPEPVHDAASGAPVYAGIGSRKTTEDKLVEMEELARSLAASGWHLHSGGADGADSAFARGAGQAHRTLYLPWKGYNECRGPDTVVLEAGEQARAQAAPSRGIVVFRPCRQFLQPRVAIERRLARAGRVLRRRVPGIDSEALRDACEPSELGRDARRVARPGGDSRARRPRARRAGGCRPARALN